MTRLARAFGGRKALIPFLTGGDPDFSTTAALVRALARAGADLVEIGVPFSDPVAEGPVIEAADGRALAAGANVDGLFDLVAVLRADLDLPLVFMTYYNPVFVYGVDRFLARAAETGLDGLIVPDLPFEESAELAGPAAAYGLPLIPMVAPTTSDDRLAAVAASAAGFVYCVSSMGVTGVRDQLGDDAARLIAKIRTHSDIPCAVGFGISTPAQAKAMAAVADGVIVGSAIVRIIAEHGRAAAPHVERFAGELRAALDEAA
ncbi:MAG: tryptophan synthase subunit alpha [Propionibacteriaceae bacterium]|jgi:tryptophan synthase alpha chain|nr:tryptophan synthase subunit alpha [Propionibacteriaceae bacterium]